MVTKGPIEVLKWKNVCMCLILIIIIWILSILIVIQGLSYSKMLMELALKLDEKNQIIEKNCITEKVNDELDNDNENEKGKEMENKDKIEVQDGDNENSNANDKSEVLQTIGKLTIPDINIKERPIYEGTAPNILSKGIGHFTNTNICNGNVGLASHNAGRKRR